MIKLRRIVTVALAAATAMTALVGPAAAAPAKPVVPELVATVTLADSTGRVMVLDAAEAMATGPIKFGEPVSKAAVSAAVVNCDGWFEVHFTLTLGVTLLRWVHRVRACVDGTNVTSLPERSETVKERALSVQVGPVLNQRLNPAPPGTVVTSYYQREFKYCSVDILECLITYQPGNFIYALGNGQFLWNPAPYS